jgi:dephospho-CoA kinase
MDPLTKSSLEWMGISDRPSKIEQLISLAFVLPPQDVIRLPGKVLAVAGMPGSGKGEVSAVAVGLGIKVLALGDVVRRYFAIHFPNGTGDKIGTFASEERSLHGKDVWARRLLDTSELKVCARKGPLLIDGLRNREETELLKRELEGGLIIIAVHSSPKLRFERLKARGRSDSPMTREDFDDRDKRELSWGVGDIIASADVMLVNDGDLEDFRRQVLRFFDGLEGLN